MNPASADAVKILKVACIFLFLIGCREDPTRNEPTHTQAPPQAPSQAPPAAASEKPAQPTCTDDPQRLCPRDEGTRDTSFVAFREQLKNAVDEKNEAKLLALVDPKIRTSFGNGGGIAEFTKQWKTSSPDSKLWSVLGKILGLGGAFRGEGDDTSFWAPYVYASWPETVDAFEHVAAIRAGVPVRERPTEDSTAVTTIDWAILKVLPSADAPESGPWRKVRTPDNQEGWVHADDMHSPVGYRAGFSKRRGAWKMDALVAGD